MILVTELMQNRLRKADRKMAIYGYARVSTTGQELEAQEAELLAAGCTTIFKEKVSGAETNRVELAKAVRRLTPAHRHTTLGKPLCKLTLR